MTTGRTSHRLSSRVALALRVKTKLFLALLLLLACPNYVAGQRIGLTQPQIVQAESRMARLNASNIQWRWSSMITSTGETITSFHGMHGRQPDLSILECSRTGHLRMEASINVQILLIKSDGYHTVGPLATRADLVAEPGDLLAVIRDVEHSFDLCRWATFVASKIHTTLTIADIVYTIHSLSSSRHSTASVALMQVELVVPSLSTNRAALDILMPSIASTLTPKIDTEFQLTSQ